MQKKIKKYIVNGKAKQFDSFAFKKLFDERYNKLGISKLEYEMKLGELLCVSHNAIHNWRFGNNGPSDIDIIKKLANYLEISDYELLLVDRKDDIIMKITERQKDSLKRIYDAIIEYLDRFRQTDGFNNYWSKLSQKGIDSKYIEGMIYDIAEKKQHKVELVLEKEYIDLYRLPVYEQLEEYVCDYLIQIYDGKLEYAYRFEAGVENKDGVREKRTTNEEYVLARKRINDILEVYM